MTARGASLRNAAVRGTSRLTSRGWGLFATAAVCAALAYGSGRVELLYAACFAALVTGCSLLVVRIRSLRLDVTRTFTPHVVSENMRVTVHVDVANRSHSRTTPATWTDRLPWPPGVAGPGRLPALSPQGRGYTIRGSSTRLEYTVRPPQRGIFDIGPFEVEHGDPFAIARSNATLDGAQKLIVTPAISDLGDSAQLEASGDGQARLLQRHAFGNDDDLMTREYRRGDALRRVHWRASARHGELMVRQEEQRGFPEARLLLDTRRDGYRDAWSDLGLEHGRSESFEWAVRMFASIGVKLHRSGYLVRLIETAPTQIAPIGDPGQGAGADFDFLVSLAGVELLWSSDAGTPGDLSSTEEAMTSSVFAVLAEPDATTLSWICSQRRPYEAGVAFVIGRSDRAVEALASAGWTTVQAQVTDDPIDVWADSAAWRTGGAA